MGRCSKTTAQAASSYCSIPDAHSAQNYLTKHTGEPEGTGDLSAFPDGGEATDYAVPALEWAVGEGVLSGFGDGSLAPTGALSRAQMAAVLYRRALAAAE